MTPAHPMTPSDRIPLGDSAWSIWPDIAVRGAGFPARLALTLRDPSLAAAADAASDDKQAAYQDAYAAAVRRLSQAVRALANDQRFREAIAWQNPALVPACLDKIARGEPRNARGRNHEQAIVSYLQRYTLKNETIGFFGPVGWARADRGVAGLSVRPGAQLLARRTTYFESWGIDELAAAIADQPGMLAWLRPRRDTACQLEGAMVRHPSGDSRELTPLQARLFALADGSRTVAQLSDHLSGDVTDVGDLADVPAALIELDRLGLVMLAPIGPIEAYPERTLAAQLELITDPQVRASALVPLTELVAARDAVAAASGDAEAVLAATEALRELFVEHTGQSGVRRPGTSYAGRTLLYQDAVRDARIEIGAAVLDALSGPLALVLDSARWLLQQFALTYREVFSQLYQAERERTGEDELPLATLLRLAAPVLFSVGRTPAEPVEQILREFQRRWREVLATDAEGGRQQTGHQQTGHQQVRRQQVSHAGISASAAAAFAVTDEPTWSTAIHHSPDVMLAAGSAQAVADGDFLLVLGELHMSVNTLEGRLFVEQHDDPERLLAWAEADHAGRRIYAIPTKNSMMVSSRGAPPSALLSPDWTYWSRSEWVDSAWPPAPVLAAADLAVTSSTLAVTSSTAHPGSSGLVVRSRSTGVEYDLLEVLSEFLAGAAINAFRPMSIQGRQPRVTIDRLVLSRESWRLPVSEAGWVWAKDESERYLLARRWRASCGLPERCFLSVPVEDKPTAVDFSSLALVNLLTKLIRRTAEADPAATIRLTEMLPDLDQLWLVDAADERYSCEFRMVAVDGAR
ncbi:MAG TPA: lantibiotic dehydratase [Jatrophihabitans sp.]|uniref:lantibiotic dehydratase n=1 Tax=Jatrophihabitans sp. TaxID=1932789 RepID=UPI002F231122